ncbi:MAG: NAD(P)/FAD-dependent oxidoreductase [Planctomycetota bacterium]|jgi:flavin-dependent dehydrogenase|nr:NAD(P)/FAD-dependent oxidoreductase [Planctomycetota bacterium]MDP7129240.1 NAD(P)/FAD-dependent oxidoreductase [Planctomycetota bacterium]
MHKDNRDFDVIVMGGGPGGSSAAAILAEHGRNVLILEKEIFPRFCIGESLVTETYWPFQRLGLLDRMRKSNYPRKYSVQFVSSSGRESQPFYFYKTNPHESSITWQVPRAEFDTMLLENAARKGAEVRQGALVKEVMFEGERAVGVVIQASGQTESLRADVIVDSTGRNALLARRLNLRQPDPFLKKAAIFAHFKNAHRGPGIDEGATLIIYSRENQAWFWYIPLPEVVSVGVVSSPSILFEGRERNPEKTLMEEIGMCPAVSERLRDATLASEVNVLSDFSYRSSQCAGPGWVLVGDAYGFLDPIYSSGVLLAMVSGIWAADAIHEGLDVGDVSGKQLGRFEPTFVRGLDAFRKLIYAFYTPDFNFGRFIKSHPRHLKNLVDILVGDVFKEDVHDIFEDMKEFVDLPDEAWAEQETTS